MKSKTKSKLTWLFTWAKSLKGVVFIFFLDFGMMGIKTSKFHLRFLYSQDLSNCTTLSGLEIYFALFLYSQDLSNCTTHMYIDSFIYRFLYSQDLSNCTTHMYIDSFIYRFLYSQDLSNCTVRLNLKSQFNWTWLFKIRDRHKDCQAVRPL